MPTYEFLNKETNEIEEHVMSYKVLDAFKEENPHLERHFSYENLPGLGDTMRMSINAGMKADAAFEKGVIERIKKTVPGNTLSRTHKTKLPREW
jgi:hypothetical protein